MPGETIEIPASLQLDVCPHCAYSLNGLAANGNCPECGQKYNSSEIVLYGYGAGRHENALTAKRSRVFWTIGSGSGWYMLMRTAQLFRHPFDLIALAATLILPFGYYLMRRTGTRHPGMVQIRFGSSGFVQYDDLRESSEFDEFVSCYSMFAIIAGLFLLAFAIWHGWLPFILSISFPLMGIVYCIMAGIYNHECRRALPKVRDGSSLNLKIARTQTWVWKKAHGFSLERKTAETWRLQVFGSLFPTKNAWNLIDAEIRCSVEQANSLHQFLSNWTKCKTFKDLGVEENPWVTLPTDASQPVAS